MKRPYIHSDFQRDSACLALYYVIYAGGLPLFCPKNRRWGTTLLPCKYIARSLVFPPLSSSSSFPFFYPLLLCDCSRYKSFPLHTYMPIFRAAPLPYNCIPIVSPVVKSRWKGVIATFTFSNLCLLKYAWCVVSPIAKILTFFTLACARIMSKE